MLHNFIQLSEIKIKDAEMKKSCQCAGRCGHKSLHVCPQSLLPQHCSQPQPSLSSLSSIDRHQRDPSPSHPSTVDRGFPFLLSVIQPLYLLSPDDPVAPKCAIEDVDVCQQGAIDCPMVLALASKATQLPRSPRLPRSLEKWAEHVTQNWANAEILLVLGKT